MQTQPNLKITTIHPTVFFVQDGDHLKQVVDVHIEAGESGWGEIQVDGPGIDVHQPLGLVSKGASLQRLYLPDIRYPAYVSFRLWSGEQLQDHHVLEWKPMRHWTIHLVPEWHHDLGYSDIPSNLVREYDRFIDDIVTYCHDTDEFPEDSRYRCVIEQGMSALHYLDRQSPEKVERLVELMRAGRVEVTALLGNETSELCGHEEQIRLLYPSFRIKRRFGIPITSAELNDVPGISWGLASVLAGAGIRYFAPGIPDYFAWGIHVHALWDEKAVLPRDLPGAFWWEGPDGQRVLFWYGAQVMGWGSPWTYEEAESTVPEALARLENGGYAYDMVRSFCIGGQRDNSPMDVRFSHISRQWNDRWAFPRMVVSTNTRFFEQFEEQAGPGLRVLRGDLPNTDYTVGATSTAHELGVNRLTHDTLMAAERFACCTALVCDYTYPAETVAEAYDSTLLGDEHTWGMLHPIGPAQAACRNQKSQWAFRGSALAHDVLSKSTNRLADMIELPQEGYHVVVFNALDHARDDVVSVQAMPPTACGRPMAWVNPVEGAEGVPHWVGMTAIGRYVVNLPPDLFDKPFDLIDLATGKSIDYQVVTLDDPFAARPLAAENFALGHTDPVSTGLLNFGLSQLKELVFVATDVPALGYRTYRIIPHNRGGSSPHTDLIVNDTTLENRYYRITIDSGSGAIVSLFDKELQREWVDGQARDGINQLVLRIPRTSEIKHPVSIHVTRGETGPVWASLISRSSAPGCPQVTQEIILYAGLKRIDFNNRVLRDATPLMEVYFAFPFCIDQPKFQFEASNSVIEPIYDQLPGTNTDSYSVQHWVSASDSQAQVVWSSLEAPVAAFSELWSVSVSQAHHGATPPDYGRDYLHKSAEFKHGHIYSYAMINNFRTNFNPVQVSDTLFRYRMTTNLNADGRQTARSFGWGVSSPLTAVVVAGPQIGIMPLTDTFCTLDQPNVLLLAIKAAENGDGLILRLIETEGRAVRVTVTLPHFEITQANYSNLMEEDQGDLGSNRHCVYVDLPANRIATVRCRGGNHWPVSTRLSYT